MQACSWLLAQTGPDTTSWLERINSLHLLWFAGIAAPVLVVVLVLGFKLIDKMHRRNAEIELKRDMLDRGMSVEEIERVLAAKGANSK
jgi:hypothetical protein